MALSGLLWPFSAAGDAFTRWVPLRVRIDDLVSQLTDTAAL